MQKTSDDIRLDFQMYGVADIDGWIESMKDSFTYKTVGGAMCVAGLLSDAQELLNMGSNDHARQTLNIAKLVLFEICDGKLIAHQERA
jgi:hypothetical protein